MNCLFCGKITKKNTTFCNNDCEINYSKMFSNNIKPNFRTYQEAGKYFKKDFRTMKKYEGVLFIINKDLPSINTKWVICKSCGEQSSTSKARAGYCKLCSKQGLGKKNQGKILSDLYKGSGNPNYLHGEANSLEYQTNEWRKLKQELNFTTCKLTGLTENIDYHHIIPRWFCNIVNIDVYDKNNIIGLNHEYHKAIHHLHLDILLLPILYSLYKKDVHQLQSQFLNLLQLHKVHQFPVDQLQSLNLFQVSRYLGKKKLLYLLPEFLQPFLSQLE
jgi:hypothetical protein